MREREGGGGGLQLPACAYDITPPKDVVIVIDKSGSMDTSGRMELTKAAVESVLTTLTQNDFVAVVMFDDTGKQLCNSVVPCGRLSQATTANKDALNALVQVVTAGGGTDFLVRHWCSSRWVSSVWQLPIVSWSFNHSFTALLFSSMAGALILCTRASVSHPIN